MRNRSMSSASTPSRPSPGRWRLAAALTAAALVLGPVGGTAAAERAVTVMLDRAQVMGFPAGTETVIVGNPIIADVTMLRNSGEIILTGKGYGETNLLFLDGRGAILSEALLRVREPSSVMVVQRGAERETYACQPRCQPTVTLGDSMAFTQRSISGIQARNGLASGLASATTTPAR